MGCSSGSIACSLGVNTSAAWDSQKWRGVLAASLPPEGVRRSAAGALTPASALDPVVPTLPLGGVGLLGGPPVFKTLTGVPVVSKFPTLSVRRLVRAPFLFAICHNIARGVKAVGHARGGTKIPVATLIPYPSRKLRVPVSWRIVTYFLHLWVLSPFNLAAVSDKTPEGSDSVFLGLAEG